MENALTSISKPTLDVVVGLGSNLPLHDWSCLVVLQKAVEALEGLQEPGYPISVSSLYRSAPVGPQQPDYLNAAVRIKYSEDANFLLAELQKIETRFGRVRLERWGPRTLDLDILYIAGICIKTPSLRVPHAELLKRSFAFLPLTELVKEPSDAVSGRKLIPEFSAVEADQLCKISSESWWKTLPQK